MKEKLEKNIKINEEHLSNLLTKKENLERQIKLLETKIQNQKFTLQHLPQETK